MKFPKPIIDLSKYRKHKENKALEEEIYSQLCKAFPLFELQTKKHLREAEKARKAVGEFLKRAESRLPEGVEVGSKRYLRDIQKKIKDFTAGQEDE